MDCAVEDFQDEEISFISDLPTIEKALHFYPNLKYDLTFYTYKYLEYVLKDRSVNCDAPELEPPFELLSRTLILEIAT